MGQCQRQRSASEKQVRSSQQCINNITETNLYINFIVVFAQQYY